MSVGTRSTERSGACATWTIFARATAHPCRDAKAEASRICCRSAFVVGQDGVIRARFIRSGLPQSDGDFRHARRGALIGANGANVGGQDRRAGYPEGKSGSEDFHLLAGEAVRTFSGAPSVARPAALQWLCCRPIFSHRFAHERADTGRIGSAAYSDQIHFSPELGLNDG